MLTFDRAQRDDAGLFVEALARAEQITGTAFPLSILDLEHGLVQTTVDNGRLAVLLIASWIDLLESISDDGRTPERHDWRIGAALETRADSFVRVASQMCERSAAGEATLTDSLAVVAASLLDTSFEVQLVDASLSQGSRAYHLRKRPCTTSPYSDLSWAIRSVGHLDSTASQAASQGLDWVNAQPEMGWCVGIAGPCEDLNTQVAAEISLAVHRRGVAVLHSRVTPERCPVQAIVTNYLTTTGAFSKGLKNLQQFRRIGQIDMTRANCPGLPTEMSTSVASAAAMLSQLIAKNQSLLVIDGLDWANHQELASLEFLADELYPTNCSILFTASGQGDPPVALFSAAEFLIAPQGRHA